MKLALAAHTAVQCGRSVAAVTGSPGMGEARFLLEGACIRLDGKHRSGFQQRVAEVRLATYSMEAQQRRFCTMKQAND